MGITLPVHQQHTNSSRRSWMFSVASSSTAWPVLLEPHHMKYTQSACWAESTDCTICMTFDLIKPCPSCSFIALQCLQLSRASMQMLYLWSQPRLHFSIACAKSKTNIISFKKSFYWVPMKGTVRNSIATDLVPSSLTVLQQIVEASHRKINKKILTSFACTNV